MHGSTGVGWLISDIEFETETTTRAREPFDPVILRADAQICHGSADSEYLRWGVSWLELVSSFDMSVS